MGARTRRLPVTAALIAGLLLFADAPAMAQQDLGHKTLGTVGLQAGRQPDVGIYVVDLVVRYAATKLMNRNGAEIPVGLDLDALAGGLGVVAVFELPKIKTFLDLAISVPVAYASVNTANPVASIDRSGLGDLFVQPLKLGWRTKHVQVVAGYGFYAPTGDSEPGGNDGVGRGHWTHQLSLGGTLDAGARREWHLSALGSYDLNMQKRDIDVTRGATVQIQGGASYTVQRMLDIGIAGYALWQVTDDSGTALPAVLRGARDTVYGLGPELDLRIPAARISLMARFEHDFGAQSRPQGEIFVFGLTSLLWRPKR
ncbi:MAG TPA: transporter [Polyangiaceae bacterium]|nr:transporter [Polyangiaceae bacterium]